MKDTFPLALILYPCLATLILNFPPTHAHDRTCSQTRTFWRKRTILWTISARCSSRLKSVRGVRMNTLVLPKATSWSNPQPCRSLFTASLSEGRSWLGQVNSEIILYLQERPGGGSHMSLICFMIEEQSAAFNELHLLPRLQKYLLLLLQHY